MIGKDITIKEEDYTPFVPKILNTPIPSKFKMLDL